MQKKSRLHLPRHQSIFIFWLGYLVIPFSILCFNTTYATAQSIPPSNNSDSTKNDSTIYVPNTLLRYKPPIDTTEYLFRWDLDWEAWTYAKVTIDSQYTTSHLFDERIKVFQNYSTLGLRYAPIQYDDFFARPTLRYNISPSFQSSWELLAVQHSNYLTTGPFSHFSAAKDFGSGEGELFARWLFTQNLAPNINFGFKIMHADDKSSMINLKSRYNIGQLFLSYVGNRSYISSSVAIRRMEHSINGGMLDPRLRLDTVISLGQYPVHHTNNNTLLSNDCYTLETGIDLLQTENIRNDSTIHANYLYRNSALTLSLVQRYNTLTRAYIEPNPPKGKQYNIADNHTHDSIASASYDIRLGIGYRHNTHSRYLLPSFRAWIGYTYDQYIQAQPLLYLTGMSKENTSTAYIGANLNYFLHYLKLQAQAYIYTLGARTGDLSLKTQIDIRPFRSIPKLCILATITTKRTRASYFEQYHFSNTATWNLSNSLLPTSSLHTGGELILPWGDLRLGVNNRIYKNYTYFDSICLPKQANSVNIFSSYLQGSVNWKGIGLTSRVTLQKSSSEQAIALPLLTTYSSLSYEFEAVPNVLFLRLALECKYRTTYHADAYNVPLGIFYRQYNFLLGNYPFLDLILNVKWKTANLFFMVNHLNDDWFGRNSFVSVLYPEKERTYRFGFQWYFYTPNEEQKAFNQ